VSVKQVVPGHGKGGPVPLVFDTNEKRAGFRGKKMPEKFFSRHFFRGIFSPAMTGTIGQGMI